MNRSQGSAHTEPLRADVVAAACTPRRGRGRGGPSRRIGLLAACLAAFLLLPVASAFATGKITVVKAGPGAVASTVTSTPAGINCGSECEHEFGASATITLTAVAGAGYSFSGWTGVTCPEGGQSASCTLSTGLLGSSFNPTATFIVTPAPPLASTGESQAAGPHAETLAGEVNPKEFAVSSCRFEYLTLAEYQGSGESFAAAKSQPCDQSSAQIGQGNAYVPVTARVAGLQANATYKYRLTAANPGGAANGLPQSFTTESAPPREVRAFAGTRRVGGAFYVEGSVNPSNSPTDYYFEYGTADCAESACTKLPLAQVAGGGSAVTVAQPLPDLPSGGTYHLRLVATNAMGTVASPEVAFRSGECPNEGIRLEQGAAAGPGYLPLCMALELASAPIKGGQNAVFPVFGEDSDELMYKSIAALGEDTGPSTLGGFDWFLAARGSGNWTTHAMTGPAGTETTFLSEKAWSSDLHRWFAIGASDRADSNQGIGAVMSGSLGGPWVTRSPQLSPLPFAGATFNSESLAKTQFQGASPDMSHVFFVAGEAGLEPNTLKVTSYLPGDPAPAGSGAVTNSYVSSPGEDGTGSLALLARNTVGSNVVYGGNCGSRVGGGPRLLQGAISSDGRRAYFSTRPGQPATGNCSTAANKLRIMRWRETPAGNEVSELFSGECTRIAPSCGTFDGSDLYQAASADGTKVYFTSNRQLANSDEDGSAQECANSTAVAGCDLYLYDATLPAGQRLIQVSAGEDVPGAHERGKEAKVYGSIAAVSGDGSHAYFVAQGVLTSEANEEGYRPVSGQPNLYVYARDNEHPNGQLGFISTLSSQDGSSGALGKVFGTGASTFLNATEAVPFFRRDDSGAEVGGDGHVFAFQSVAPLTASDADSGQLDDYLYDSVAKTLTCISCGPAGGASGQFGVGQREGVGSITGPGSVNFRRWVSEDGRSAVFSTRERLSPFDDDEAETAYLWHDGKVSMLPGEAPYGLPVVSSEGDEVAFESSHRLTSEDGDAAVDVYVARIDGGYREAGSVEACRGEVCQGGSRPGAGAGADTVTRSYRGRGNLPLGKRDCRAEVSRAHALKARARRLRQRLRQAAAPSKRDQRKVAGLLEKARRSAEAARRCRSGPAERWKPRHDRVVTGMKESAK